MNFLGGVEGQYDCVLFDCPPGFGTISRAALQLSDHIVAPTIADYTSMRSLHDFVALGLKDTLHINVDRRLHVVVSKFTRTVSQQQALDVLKEGYRVVASPIPMRDQVQVIAERHATKVRTYARKYGWPVHRPRRPHVKGMSDALYNAIFQT
jgi:cellulose biosynthesis protein BcsQ